MSRYVLKNKDTGAVLFVVVFTLLSKDKIDGDEVKKAESVQLVAQGKGEEMKQEIPNKAKDEIEAPDDSVD